LQLKSSQLKTNLAYICELINIEQIRSLHWQLNIRSKASIKLEETQNNLNLKKAQATVHSFKY